MGTGTGLKDVVMYVENKETGEMKPIGEAVEAKVEYTPTASEHDFINTMRRFEGKFTLDEPWNLFIHPYQKYIRSNLGYMCKALNIIDNKTIYKMAEGLQRLDKVRK